jgi:two-component system cell cycle sensor histidine kinase PleC
MCSRTPPSSLADDGAVTLTIADEGIGMTPAELETALKPFAQVESIYTRKTGGTGLGLPIIRGLMELHGGTVEIQSARDQGTTVRLVFPGPVAVYATPAAMGGD